jgi:hypothetical protein
MAASALASISRGGRAAEHTHTIMSQSSAASIRGPSLSAPVSRAVDDQGGGQPRA